MSGCDRCGGVGFEIVDEGGREVARPCSCRSRAVSGDPVGSCRIPPRYETCSLATFSPYNQVHAAAHEAALRYCSSWPFAGSDEGLGLLFSGGNGVGKTHLAVAVLRELGEQKGVRGQFWDFHELMREIRNSFDPSTQTTEYQVLAPIIETDLLLLDDLGAWRITDWMNDTLFHILNSRYVAKRPTLITTNFVDASAEEIRKADPAVKKEFLVDRIGLRLRSRILEMCLLVRMEGTDFREMKQQSNRFAVLGTSAKPAR